MIDISDFFRVGVKIFQKGVCSRELLMRGKNNMVKAGSSMREGACGISRVCRSTTYV